MLKNIFCLIAFIMCAHSLAAKDILVKDIAAFNTANNVAQPGDRIILQGSEWKDVRLRVTCTGTAAKPIQIFPEQAGGLNITGFSNLLISGKYVTISGLHFKNGQAKKGNVISFSDGKDVANHCRLTKSDITSFNPANRMDDNHWITISGKNNRLDHCSFIDKTNIGVTLAVLMDDDRSRQSFHSIDSNYFGLRKPLGSNGGETIRIGVSQHCTFYSNTDIHNNIFENCDGETEIISVKSCGNKVRNNLFKECQGSVVLRHGNDNVIDGNLFLGNGKTGTGGVRVINEEQLVVNNYFYRCTGTGFRAPLAIMNGVPNSPANRYLPVRNALIANNTFYDCSPIVLGEGADAERSMPPKETYIINNIFFAGGSAVLGLVKSDSKGISMSQNLVSTSYSDSLAVNQKQGNIQVKVIKGLQIAHSNEAAITASLSEDLNNLIKNYPDYKADKIGVSNVQAVANLLLYRDWLLKQIFLVDLSGPKIKQQSVTVKNGNSLALALSNPAVKHISIANKSIQINNLLTVNGNKILSSKKKEIRFTSPNMNALFLLQENSNLQLSNLSIDALGVQAKTFIVGAATGNVQHCSVLISSSEFKNFSGNSFIEFQKSAYADAINIQQSTFKNIHANLFVLNSETDAKGYYNVEKMAIINCDFKEIKGFIADVARTGTDESTLGPTLEITGNKFKDIKANQPLFKLYGVQQSYFNDNEFEDANANATSILYLDKVSAKHLYGANKFKNSGNVESNQYVIIQ